jgi:hypothetical protein
VGVQVGPRLRGGNGRRQPYLACGFCVKAQAGSRGLWKALDGCAVADAGFRESRAARRPTAATPVYSANRRRAQNVRIGLPLARLVTGPDRKARSRRTVLP